MPGLEKIPLRIPEKWDANWYLRHIREVLALADVRNAIEGDGISITGTSDIPATISASADILALQNQTYIVATASAFLPNERVLTGATGIISVTDGGAGSTITLDIEANAINNARLAKRSGWSVMGRSTVDYDDVGNIFASTDGDVLRVLGSSLGFGDIILRPSNFANPSASVGLTATNGSAITAMRSDAAPALDVTISPTWTGTHTFNITPVVPNNSWTYAKIQDVSATSRFLGRITSGAGDIEELTGAQAFSLIQPSGVALTRTDDTNVTMTLGGSASTALVNAASLTLGWTGTLAKTRGGFGLDATTLTGYVKAAGAGAITASATIPYSDITGGPSAVTGANPTAVVGLSAVNGSAGTFLRSDGAPALSQSISPTWTGTHLFTGDATVGAGTYAGISPGSLNADIRSIFFSDPTGVANENIWEIRARFDAKTFSIRTIADAVADSRAAWSATRGSGYAVSALEYGNATDNPSHTFYGQINGNGAGLTTVPYASLTGAPTLASGTYTPTGTNVSNAGSLAMQAAQYLRVGNTVTASGRLTFTTSAGSPTTIGISFPVASAIANANEVAGTYGISYPTNSAQGGPVYGDATNDRAELFIGNIGSGIAVTLYYQFTYQVI
jgi:hypothetical protein